MSNDGRKGKARGKDGPGRYRSCSGLDVKKPLAGLLSDQLIGCAALILRNLAAADHEAH